MLKRMLVLFLMVSFTVAMGFAGASAEQASRQSGTALTKLDKPVTVVVPFPVGSAIDVRARIVMKYAEKQLGTTVVIENKPGAAGLIGATEFVTGKSKGYDILFCGVGVFTAVPLFNQAAYSLDDIVPLVSVDKEQFGMFVNPDKSGIRTIEDLKSFGRNIKYSTGAPGSIGYISCTTALLLMGVPADLIVTAGASISLTENLGGHNDIAFAGLGLAKGFVDEGKLLPLFTFNAEDYLGYEGVTVPSLHSLGIDYDYESLTFFSMKKSEDQAVVDFVKNVLVETLKNEACRAELVAAGASTLYNITTEEIVSHSLREYEIMREYGPKIGLTLTR